jgi:integrase/recombinase XerC/integrase/recombinase XerD
MIESTIKMAFARLAKRAGVPRLHIHLLRHTFATRYLMNGGDVFSLQRILGHTTLEMTRRYVDMVVLDIAVKQKRLSAMDRMFLNSKGRETTKNENRRYYNTLDTGSHSSRIKAASRTR